MYDLVILIEQNEKRLQEKDNSSDIEQQPPFGIRK